MKRIIYIGLGSNIGSGDAILDQAIEEISALEHTKVLRVSSRYRTEPQGDPAQPWFTNQVAEIESELEPVQLLDALHMIENRLGRVRDEAKRYGPRTLDLDILLYGDERISRPKLTVPHPRIQERAFVLVPLIELVPSLALPGGNFLTDSLSELDYHLDGRNIYQK